MRREEFTGIGVELGFQILGFGLSVWLVLLVLVLVANYSNACSVCVSCLHLAIKRRDRKKGDDDIYDNDMMMFSCRGLLNMDVIIVKVGR